MNNAREQLNELISTTARVCDLSEEEIMSHDRVRKLVDARKIICHIAVRVLHLNLSLIVIGRVLGNRDHSTVINSWQSADDLLFTDPDFKRTYTTVLEKLRSYKEKYHGSDYLTTEQLFNHSLNTN